MTLVHAETGEPSLQVMPELDAETNAALTDSIRTYGVLTPIIVSQNGEIIDGHNRWRIANELDVHCPSEVREVADEAEALDLARTLNLDRRHIDKSARLPLARSLREKGFSLRAIGGALGVAPNTVRSDLGVDVGVDDAGDGVQSCTPSPAPAKITGTDGVQQPAKKRQWTADALAELLAKRKAGASLKALEEEYGLSQRRVLERLATARLTEGRGSTTRDAINDRENKVREMASNGHTSRQIAKAVGVGVPAVKEMAKRLGVDIAADGVVGKTRQHDSNRIVAESTIAIEGIVSALDLADPGDLDASQVADWAASLTRSIQFLNRFNKQMKETAR